MQIVQEAPGVSKCLFPPRLHATHSDFLTSSFNRARLWGACLLWEARQQQHFNKGLSSCLVPFYFRVCHVLSSSHL